MANITIQGTIAAVERAADNFRADLMRSSTHHEIGAALADVARDLGIQRSAWWVLDRDEESRLFEAAVKELQWLADDFNGAPPHDLTAMDKVRVLSARGIVDGLVEAARFHKRAN